MHEDLLKQDHSATVTAEITARKLLFRMPPALQVAEPIANDQSRRELALACEPVRDGYWGDVLQYAWRYAP